MNDKICKISPNLERYYQRKRSISPVSEKIYLKVNYFCESCNKYDTKIVEKDKQINCSCGNVLKITKIIDIFEK